MKNYFIYSLFLSLLFVGCTEETPVIPEGDQVVLRGYLYAGKPVNDIELSTTYALDEELDSAPVISDATISILHNGHRYDLIPTVDAEGFYHYPGTDLDIIVGDEYGIEVEYYEKVASSQTVVPSPPSNIGIGSGIIHVPDFDNIDPDNRPDFEDISFLVYWDNPESDFHYLVIENIEVNPIEIETSFAGKQAMFISEPVRTDSFRVSVGMVTHLGTHNLRIYRVNQEYADMYEWRDQDTRDLNEPLTNVENGLGIFSAFNSDDMTFEVVQD